MFKILFLALILCPIIGFSQILTNSTSISITKTWSSQPSGYTYPISISVPSGSVPAGGFPVCILLHGNGSQNLMSLAGPPMLVQFGTVLPCHILVAPTGFQNSWNICRENSDAPDVDMINDLVNNLQSYANVNRNKIRVLGTSNGAGLANRVFIENTNRGIDIICAIVSHLNDFQYHLGNFYKPSGITNPNSSFCGYDVVSSPLTTRKYLSISNDNDPIIPYVGGLSNVGATFLPAETAALNIATYKGYSGSKLTSGTVIGSSPTAITEFSYLSGNVVHIKGNAFHQANATQKTYITDYFSACGVVVPVQLLYFQGYTEYRKNVLQWQTASEQNNAGFEVEKSPDGRFFEKIGFVVGNGTTNERQTYKFVDNKNLSGVNTTPIAYYRLKQIDFNGNFKFSNTLQLSSNGSLLLIYPNPVSDVLTIENGEGDVTIYNAVGQLVRQFEIIDPIYMLNTNALPKGIYTLKMRKVDGITTTKKIVISRD